MSLSALPRRLLGSLTMFAVVWGGTILYWRRSGHVPTGMDMLVWLGVVPAGLLGGTWMLRALAARAADSALARASAADEASAAASGATAAPAAAEPAHELRVLATALQLPCDLQAEALLSAPDTLARPGLYPELKDQRQWPVFAGFVADLDMSQSVGGEVGARFARAQALLQPVLDELLPQVMMALPPLSAPEEPVVAGWRRQSQTVVACELTVECLVEAEMPEAVRAQMSAWLETRLNDQGLKQERYRVDVLSMADTGQVWERLQGLADEVAEQAHWHLLLVTASAIDPVVIERWQQQGQLYSGESSQGRIPGEAAAGVLLANAAVEPAAAIRLQRPQRLQLPASLTSAQRMRQTAQLAEAVCHAAALQPAELGFVISDAIGLAELTAETGQVAQTLSPDIDAICQSLSLQVGTGDIGPVAPLAMLALAHVHHRASGDAVMLLGIAEAGNRWASCLHADVAPVDPSPTRPEQGEID